MEAQKKIKVLFHSDFSLAKTGFGRNARTILSYLYKTDKYEIVHYCCAMNKASPDLQRTPWKSIGCLPDDPREAEQLKRDAGLERFAAYGGLMIDEVVLREKPDVYIGVQDFWGTDFAIEKPWFKKLNSVIWTTLDSLPILHTAVEAAPKIKNYFVWSSFAEKALHKLGHTHVKTLHGAIDDSKFYRLLESERQILRKIFGIEEDAFVIGFLFRNQLRKSIPNLLEGYKLWKDRNPEVKKSYLLLHTHFGEGWDIMKLAKEYGVDTKEILCTYICRVCKKYQVKLFSGQDQDCPHCRMAKAQVTVQISCGISEDELNEIYNLMDVYVHPMTSGGQEIPVQEAKLTELITLVTNYSCGEELCEEGSGSLPLEFSEYREFGTQFIKSNTSPSSIAKQLTKVYKMTNKERRDLGKIAREWVLKGFSINVVGKQLETFLDSCKVINEDLNFNYEQKNPGAQIPYIENDKEWVKYLYKNVLNMDVADDDPGLLSWLSQLSSATDNKPKLRKDIESYFRQTAAQKNAEQQKVTLADLIDKDDDGKRILYVIPESIGDVFLSTSLFKSLKEQYPNYNLYVSTKSENSEILEGNPFVHKVIPYAPQMDNIFLLEGIGKNKGPFEIAFLPFIGTQRMIDYTHNAKDSIAFNIKY